MRIFVLGETEAGEMRVPLVPATAAKLVKLGASVEVEPHLGARVHFSDDDYRAAGAGIAERRAGLAGADLVLRLRKLPSNEVALLKRGAIHVSYLDPFNERELVRALAEAGVTAVSMEMIPRST